MRSGDFIKILLVEDSPVDIHLVREMLDDAMDRSILPAVDLVHVEQFSEALQRLGKGHFDVVLLDLSLPDSQGLDTFVKAHAQAPDVPMVVLTGLADVEMAVKAVREGAQDYLVKGEVDSNLLVRAIRYAIERKRAEEQLHLLQTTARAISEAEDLHSAMGIVLRKVCDATGWVFGRAWIPSVEGTCLECSPTWYSRVTGLEKFEEASEAVTFPPGIGLPGRVWSSKQPVWVRDATSEKDFPRAPAARKVGLKAGVAIPVLARHEVVAVLEFFLLEPREEDESLVRLISAVAAQLGSLIQRKRAEEEREKIRAQLVRSQRMESVGRLAGGIAHDFNNMLAIIQGQTDLMMMTLEESDPLYPNLEEIRRASVRAAKLVYQLLLFSRRQSMELTSLDMSQMIHDLLKTLKSLIGEEMAIHTHLEPDLWMVQADEASIERVIMNLAVNARDAMPEGGTITIATENVTLDERQCKAIPEARPGRFVRLVVTDTGVGMEEEILPRIFEPFFTTKEFGKGTGLGLSMIYGIVKQHNGWIQVSSEPGQGSTFQIYLPAFSGKLEEDPQVVLPVVW